jgi:hypothetical protein
MTSNVLLFFIFFSHSSSSSFPLKNKEEGTKSPIVKMFLFTFVSKVTGASAQIR